MRRLGRANVDGNTDEAMGAEDKSNLDYYWQPGSVVMPAPTMSYPRNAKCQTILPQVAIATTTLRTPIPRRTWFNNQLAVSAEDLTLAELERVIAEVTADGATEAAVTATLTDEALLAIKPLPWVQLLTSMDADKLMADILHRPLEAQLTLLAMSLDMTQLPLLLRLHTIHRWLATTKPLAPVIAFGARYYDVVGYMPTWEVVQDFMTSYKPPAEHGHATSGLSGLDVELCLSLFELALAPHHYKHDAMIIIGVGHAVDWIPAYNSARMLTPRCLFELLKAPIGHAIVTHLCAVASNPYTLKLLALQQCEQLYSLDHLVVLHPLVGATAAVLASPRRC